MSWEHASNDWSSHKHSIKQRWASLTDEDVDGIDGTRDRLEHLIEKYYKKARDEVKQEVDEWATSRR